jgi:signal transduction histidine kinase
VIDNGIGLPPQRLDETTSLGIVGMRERALAVGGSLSITGIPFSGTTVLLSVPLRTGKSI